MFLKLLQIFAILGFILSIFKMNIGFFIGFFFTGVYLLFLKNENSGNRKFNIIFSIFSFVVAFYFLFLNFILS